MNANQWIDPNYVLISKKEAASICCMSTSEFDKRRVCDDACPKGFKESASKTATVRFRLSDVYAYSSVIIERSVSEEEE